MPLELIVTALISVYLVIVASVMCL